MTASISTWVRGQPLLAFYIFVPAEAAVTVLLAAIVVILFESAHLSRRGTRVVQIEGS